VYTQQQQVIGAGGGRHGTLRPASDATWRPEITEMNFTAD